MENQPQVVESSDKSLMDLLRSRGAMRISELADAMGVNGDGDSPASDSIDGGWFCRAYGNRGSVTRAAQSRLRPIRRGSSSDRFQFADLAIALWQEVRTIKDPEIRRGLMQRVSKRLAGFYAEQIEGETVKDRMASIAGMLGERDIPFEVSVKPDENGQLPVLKALGCPYTELAEQDRSICAMERMLFAELIGHGLVLSQCRLDGENCCTFELN